MTLISAKPGHFTSNPPLDLTDPKLYANRELSWLQFNHRLDQAARRNLRG
jgi:polyphosphate kinase